MACIHLNQLYQLCHRHGLRFSGADLIRIVCSECGEEDTCPSLIRESAEPKEVLSEERGSSDSHLDSHD